jgi:putative ABC transport system permease protein
VAAALPHGVEAVPSQQIGDEQAESVRKGLGFFTKALLGFAAVALLVGSFLIWNTFSVLVAQRSRELGLLRAVGATRRQVLAGVVGEAVVVGLVAAAAGIGLGLLAALGLRGLLSAVGIDLPTTTLQLAPHTVTAAVLVGLLVTVLSALVPARAATRIPPVAALRDAATSTVERPGRRRTAAGSVLLAVGAALLVLVGIGGDQPGTAGLGALAAFLGLVLLGPAIAGGYGRLVGAARPGAGRAATGAGWAMAARNLARAPRRAASTALALTIGLSLVAAVTVMASSIKSSVRDVVASSTSADLLVRASSQVAPGIPVAAAQAVRGVDGVALVSEARFGPAKVGSSKTYVGAIDAGTAGKVADLQIRSGRLTDLRGDSLLVSTSTARSKHLAVGDRLPVSFPSGGRIDARVVGTFDNDELIGSAYVLPLATYAAHTVDGLDAIVFVGAEEGVSEAGLQQRVSDALAAYPGVTVDTPSGFADAQGAAVDSMLNLVSALLLLAIVVALLGIVNTLALAVMERTREIGLLRAVGATRQQVRRVVRREAVLTAVLGALLGTGLGVGAGVALVRSLADEGLHAVTVPVGQLGVYLVLAAFAGVVAAIGPARRASKVDVLRAVTTE